SQGGRLQEYAEETRKAASRIASLTRQMLAFSRKQVLKPQVVNLNGLLADAEPMLQRLVGEEIEVAVFADPNVGTVEVDPGQLNHVLIELAMNSRDAMTDGGTLTLETREVELDEVEARRHPEAHA